MSKIMQDLVVLMEPSEAATNVSLKGGNMILNRFCIDEDAAFELSGVNYLKNFSSDIMISESIKFELQIKVKGRGDSFLRSYFISRNLIFTKH